jgi:hypothetical protein
MRKTIWNLIPDLNSALNAGCSFKRSFSIETSERSRDNSALQTFNDCPEVEVEHERCFCVSTPAMHRDYFGTEMHAVRLSCVLAKCLEITCGGIAELYELCDVQSMVVQSAPLNTPMDLPLSCWK